MTPSSEPRPLPKRWQVHHQIPNDIYRELGDFSPLMRQLLYNRGFESSESAAAFINGTVDFPTDPFLIKDMDAAVERLHKAVTGEKRLSFTVTMTRTGSPPLPCWWNSWPRWGVEARPYIPDRYDEGYGLNDDAIRLLAGEGIKLIITVDCGVRALGEITFSQ